MKTTSPNRPRRPRCLAMASLLLLGSLAASPASAQTEQQVNAMIDQVEEWLLDNNPVGAALLAINQLLEGATNWTPQLWNDAVAVAEQAGVAVDDLIATVHGCVRQPGGAPVVAAPVLVLPATGFDLGFVPIVAFTAGEAAPASFMLTGTAAPTPVLPSFMSEAQRLAHGPGCYWAPIPPGAMQLALSAGSGGAVNLVRVIPLVPGFTVSPPGLEIRMDPVDGGGREISIVPSYGLGFTTEPTQ